MLSADPLQAPPPIAEQLRALESRLATLGRAELREALGEVSGRLRERLPADEAGAAVDTALALCRRLYGSGRSGEALPLAKAARAQCIAWGDPARLRRAATACGLLSADMADLVEAVSYHVEVLRIAADAGDAVEMSGAWNNMGLAMGIAGHYEMAARCYQRALGLVHQHGEPIYSRYTACGNLARSLYEIGSYEEGLHYACLAMAEQTPEFRQRDLHSAMLLRRNLVRLLVASGRTAEAEPHVNEVAELAALNPTPRGQIAAATTRAIYELSIGLTDLALTRLEKALVRAREVPATLRETLACVIRAEEASGNVERALLRLNELSDHIYKVAVNRAREHVELSSLPPAGRTGIERDQEQARARLVSKVSPPAIPAGWDVLDRLAVGACLRMDETGWHGKRVGALTKALAGAAGIPALQAMEMGLAAELHDIGMMSVPEGILQKRTPLNDAERNIVRRHVDAGAEILRDDRHPRIFLAREIARYHHAHWDGGGHPERVGGKLIPLAARVCAVADAYDAMVCGLGAQPRRTMDDALGELGRLAGVQFDPDLVVRFDALVRSETEDLGVDLTANAGMQNFQELVDSLQEDRGFA